jgi:hypothetical protein
MRVLISTRLGAGHFGPLIPFAHALLRGNHEVVVVAPACLQSRRTARPRAGSRTPRALPTVDTATRMLSRLAA